MTQQVNAIVRRMNELPKVFSKRERRRVLRKAGKAVVESAKAKAPVSPRAHFRYSTPKLIGKLKAPKGSGVIAATYKPGNLRASIRVLTFRRADEAVFVGPKLAKRNQSKEFGPGTGSVDGFYAGFVEFGTVHAPARPFMRPAWDATKDETLRIIVAEAEKMFKKYAQQLPQ